MLTPFRQNLDISGNKTDEELWTALEIALCKDAVSDMADGLDTRIVDEGKLPRELCNDLQKYRSAQDM